MDRRRFITTSLALTASAAVAPKLMAAPAQKFKISLAEWSLHKALFEKKMDNLDFARVAREDPIWHLVSRQRQDEARSRSVDAQYGVRFHRGDEHP